MLIFGEKSIYLIELNDVWMTDFFENLDFTCDSLNILFVLNFFLLKNFDSNLLF
jgi:hypothetical protein